MYGCMKLYVRERRNDNTPYSILVLWKVGISVFISLVMNDPSNAHPDMQ